MHLKYYVVTNLVTAQAMRTMLSGVVNSIV